jgi:glutamate carboxypeptidase
MSQWNNDPKVRFLRQLVEMNSGTQNIEGVNRVQDLVAERSRKMGLAVRFEKATGSQTSGKFLIAEVMPSGMSTAQESEPASFIHLVTHADTVFEPDSGFSGFELDEAKGVATGPGVIDDKGGIVVALEGLERALKKCGNQLLPVRFICTPTEEIGSPGFHPLLQELGKDSWMILGFEPSLEDGSIVKSRRGNRWYQIEVSGKEAHVGRNFDQGVNAAHELAHKITQFEGLNDAARDLTLSVGQISGGSKFNIVCAHAEAKLDVRFADFQTRDQTHHRITKIIEKSHIHPNVQGMLPGSRYEISDDCPPVPSSDHSEHYVKAYLDWIEKVEGRRVQAQRSGGAADANYMSREGLVILDGLGATGGGMHRKDEFIRLSSLETRAECLYRFLESISLDQKKGRTKK